MKFLDSFISFPPKRHVFGLLRLPVGPPVYFSCNCSITDMETRTAGELAMRPAENGDP